MSPRVLVLGASASATCGVRDHAAALAPDLAALGAQIDTVWWDRDPAWSSAQTRRSARDFNRRVGAALAAKPDVVLWHYSVFDYGPRTAWDLSAAPVHALASAAALRRSPVPVLVWAHEAAFSFREPGWQRKALAVAQRAALVSVVAGARGVVVAGPGRERWLGSRRWLPPRPLAVIPVCGTVGPAASPPPETGRAVVGVLGFGADDARADTVAGAIGMLRRRGIQLELRMLGAPGESGRMADRWRAATRRAGCASALRFTGVVPERELSREIDSSQVVLFPNGSGPVAGKTTIASALGHRRPVVAVDGPLRWDRLREAGALRLARPTPEDVAYRLAQLLEDPAARDRQAAAGEDFYRRELSPAVCAERLLRVAGEVAR